MHGRKRLALMCEVSWGTTEGLNGRVLRSVADVPVRSSRYKCLYREGMVLSGPQGNVRVTPGNAAVRDGVMRQLRGMTTKINQMKVGHAAWRCGLLAYD
eukprot:3488942-Rhodomonas_salina.1